MGDQVGLGNLKHELHISPTVMTDRPLETQSEMEKTENAGPQLISLLCVVLTQGILSVQVWIYHLAFNDRLYLKALVNSVYILETGQTMIVIYHSYATFVRRFADLPPSNALDVVGLLWIWYLTGGLVTLAVQCLYAYRIYAFGGATGVFPCTKASLVISMFIVLLSLVQFVGAIMLGLEVHRVDSFSQPLSHRETTLTELWNGTGVLCDTIIAVSMTYLLYKSSECGMQRTQGIVRKLIRLTIETGTCTIIAALINIIIVHLPREPTKFYEVLLPIVATGILSKIYANMMLVLLNSRAEFVSEAQEMDMSPGAEQTVAAGELGHIIDSHTRLRFYSITSTSD